MEALVTGYTDVWINKETCEIRKEYNNRPNSYISPDNKKILTNLKSLRENGPAKRANILAEYKKSFGKTFNGDIIALGHIVVPSELWKRDIFTYHITNGKITGQTPLKIFDEKYFYYDPSRYCHYPTVLGQTEYESLYRR